MAHTNAPAKGQYHRTDVTRITRDTIRTPDSPTVTIFPGIQIIQGKKNWPRSHKIFNVKIDKDIQVGPWPWTVSICEGDVESTQDSARARNVTLWAVNTKAPSSSVPVSYPAWLFSLGFANFIVIIRITIMRTVHFIIRITIMRTVHVIITIIRIIIMMME